MDWLTFISKMTSSLAWPIVVLLVLFYGKDDFMRLLRVLKSIKLGNNIEATFSEKAEEIASQASEVIHEAQNCQDINLKDELLSNSPRDSIYDAWVKIEQSAKKALQLKDKYRYSAQDSSPPLKLIIDLKKEGIINVKQAKLIDSLRKLQLELARIEDGNLPYNDVENFIDAAISVIKFLDSYTP